MKRLIRYGSIGQFRNVVKSIQMDARFVGLDDDGEPMFDKGNIAPTLDGIASEKIHGTNGSVCFSAPDGFWVQSKENIITPEKDNGGCARHAYDNEETWMNIIHGLANHYQINMQDFIITVYFEWSGGSIQKKSACTGLEKRAIIFQHFKVSPIEPTLQEDPNARDERSYWLETRLYNDLVDATSCGIYNIMNYETQRFKIDFDQPALSQNQMVEAVTKIEEASPYGKAMGCEANVGEGIVVTVEFGKKLYKFKVKGDKHSASKVKKLKPVDEAKEKAKIEFANYACSPSRLEQAWQEVFGIDNSKAEPDIKFTGDIIRTVIKDIMKEEMDIIKEKGLEVKEINPLVSKITRMWFINELNSNF